MLPQQGWSQAEEGEGQGYFLSKTRDCVSCIKVFTTGQNEITADIIFLKRLILMSLWLMWFIIEYTMLLHTRVPRLRINNAKTKKPLTDTFVFCYFFLKKVRFFENLSVGCTRQASDFKNSCRKNSQRNFRKDPLTHYKWSLYVHKASRGEWMDGGTPR